MHTEKVKEITRGRRIGWLTSGERGTVVVEKEGAMNCLTHKMHLKWSVDAPSMGCFYGMKSLQHEMFTVVE